MLPEFQGGEISPCPIWDPNPDNPVSTKATKAWTSSPFRLVIFWFQTPKSPEISSEMPIETEDVTPIVADIAAPGTWLVSTWRGSKERRPGVLKIPVTFKKRKLGEA